MKKILVPVDFSACSNAAVEVALRLAQKSAAEIYFLHLYLDWSGESHVLHGGENLILGKHDQNAVLGKSKDELEKIVAKAKALGIQATPILTFDKRQQRIENYLRPYGIDFVVMGSHGVRGIRETILGSNTQRFIRRSHVPVLVVKEKSKDFEISKIVYASSFEEDSISSFEAANAIAKLWGAEIYLLYVNTPYHFRETHESMFNIKRFMHQFPKVAYTPVIYDALDEERGLAEFTRQNKMDLIALSTHGKKGFMRLLSHGVAEIIINHQAKPVLVVNTHVVEEEKNAPKEAAVTR